MRKIDLKLNGRECSIEGCVKPHNAKGYCKMHWYRVQRQGSPHVVLRDFGSGLTREARFWSKVALTANPARCWEWRGVLDVGGYGKCKYKGVFMKCHRVAWLLVYGKLPEMFLLHSCDNRACVNPNHLREGTMKENMQDAMDRNRIASGERQGLSKLTWAKVAEIRVLLKNGSDRKSVAQKFNVGMTAIACISRNETWRLPTNA